MRKFIIAALAATGLLLGAVQAQATEAPFTPYDTAAGGAQSASDVSTVTADTVTLVQDGRDTATAGTSAETSNLGIEVQAGDTITVDYALADGASPAAGAVRLFIYYSTDADTWNTAPDQVAIADADSGTLSITATGGTIGTAGVVYDTSNPSTGEATFTGFTVAGEAVPFLPVAQQDDDDTNDGSQDDDDSTDDSDTGGGSTDDDTNEDKSPVAVPTEIPAGVATMDNDGAKWGLLTGAGVVLLFAGAALLRLRTRNTPA